MILLLLLIGIFAILLAVAFGAWLLYQRELSAKPAAPENAVRQMASPDGNLRAEIRDRLEGTFQVEILRRRVNETESGSSETWDLVDGPAITGTLAEAVEIANQRIGDSE